LQSIKETYYILHVASHRGNSELQLGLVHAEMMANSAPLDISLHELAIPTEAKCSIINSLWSQGYKPQAFAQIVPRTDSYFRYYQKQCELVRHGNECIAQDHRGIIEAVELLKILAATREEVKSNLKLKSPNPDADNIEDVLSNSIDLAARIWLMVNIGGFRRVLMPGRPLNWTEGCLGDFMMSKFSREKVLKEHVKLEKLFNAYNLSRIAAIEIVWTSNLADHLRMQDDDTRVAVFHHAFFLENRLEWYVFD
jgi:hypothetical protein